MKKLLVIALSTLAIFGVLSAIDAIAAPYYPAQGGTGTGTIPQSGQILIGNGSSTYTPAYLLCSGNCSVANASGSVIISVSAQTSSTIQILPVSVATSSFSIVGDGSYITVTNPGTSTIKIALSTSQVLQLLSASSPLAYNSSTGQFTCASCLTSLNGALLVLNNLSDVASTTAARNNLGLGSISTFSKTDYLTSSTVYVSSVNGLSGAVTITSSSLGVFPISINGNQAVNFFIVPGAGLTSTISGATTTLTLNLSTGCSGGNFVQTISPTGTISCAVPTTTIFAGNSFIGVNQVGSNATITPASVLSHSNNSASGGIDFSAATGTNITGVLHSLAISQFTGNIVNTFNGATGTIVGVNSVNGATGTVVFGYVSSFNGATGTVTYSALQNASITATTPVTWSVGNVIACPTCLTSTPAYLLSINGDTTQAQFITVSGGILTSSTAAGKTTIGLSTTTLNTNVAALGYITSTPAGTVYLASTTPWTLGGLVIASTTGSVTTIASTTYYLATNPSVFISNISTTINTAGPLTGGGSFVNGTTLSLACATCIATNTGNWAGTLSNLHATDFAPSTTVSFTGVTADSPLSGAGTSASHLVFTNPGYISANQSITFTESGDVTSTASGATSLTPTAHVVAIQGYAVTSSAPSVGDVLQYTAAGWVHNPTSSLGISGGGGIATTTPWTLGNVVTASTTGSVTTITTSTLFTNLGLSANATSTTPIPTTATSSFSFVIEYPTAAENDDIWIAPYAATVKTCYAVNKTLGDTVTIGFGYSTSRATATSSLTQIATSTVTATTTPASLTILNASVAAGDPVIFWSTAASSTQFSLTCSVLM
jgi:hypothetical protein